MADWFDALMAGGLNDPYGQGAPYGLGDAYGIGDPGGLGGLPAAPWDPWTANLGGYGGSGWSATPQPAGGYFGGGGYGGSGWASQGSAWPLQKPAASLSYGLPLSMGSGSYQYGLPMQPPSQSLGQAFGASGLRGRMGSGATPSGGLGGYGGLGAGALPGYGGQGAGSYGASYGGQPSGYSGGTSNSANVQGGGGFAMPLDPGGVYGQQKWSGGNGIDIFTRRGSPIYAVMDGQVSPATGGQSPIGPVGSILLRGNNGISAQYTHVVGTATGPVKRGQVIGYVYDPSMDMLGAYQGMPDGFQHLDLTIGHGGPFSIPAPGGDINAAQFLQSIGYRGQQIGGTTRGPNGGGGGMGGGMGLGGPFGQMGLGGFGGGGQMGGGFNPMAMFGGGGGMGGGRGGFGGLPFGMF